MNSQLIFDIGFHHGEDTRYYLYEGFNVIAVDAVKEMIDLGKQMFPQEVACGRLTFEQAVVSQSDSEAVPFYISPNSLWNSAHQEIAERNGMHAERVMIPAVSLRSLMKKYGVPYYCKIDIEGNDILALKSLKGSSDLPQYISVETECIGERAYDDNTTYATLDTLKDLGYTKFKLVDQATLQVLDYTLFYGNSNVLYTDAYGYAKDILHHENVSFQHYFPNSSGPFGEKLRGTWFDYADAKQLIRFHSEAQRKLGYAIWSFWCDWHATI